jgi:FkbM family methyltransferase
VLSLALDLPKWFPRRRMRTPRSNPGVAVPSPASTPDSRIANLVARTQPTSSFLQGMDERVLELARAMPKLLALRQFASMDRFALEALCRAQAQPLYLGDNSALCRVLSRYKLLLDTRDRGFAAHVLLDGYWEMWLTIFMCRHIQPGMVVIDVGANFGYYTILMADLVGPEGHTFAIEPNPVVAALLRQSVTLNGFRSQTSIVEAAAGASRSDQVWLYSPNGEFKNACIVESPNQVSVGDGTLHQVGQVTIDDIVSTSPRVDFLKIDAEGAEESIVEGMCQCLRDHRPSLIVEFNAARCKEPEVVLERLIATYKIVSYLDYSSNIVQTTVAELVSQRVGEDWLLFFDRETALL